MKPVLTWQHGHLIPKLHIVYANGALRLSILAHHRLVQFLLFELRNGVFGSWWRSVGLRVGFHQLADDLVEVLLRVCGIAVKSMDPAHTRTEKKGEQVLEVSLERTIVRSSHVAAAHVATTHGIAKDARVTKNQ